MRRFEGKKLLILGGMELYREVIAKAKELGATVYVTDYLENSPAKKYADKACMVSATDIPALKKLCENEGIDGIFTGYADVLLPFYAQLCLETGLPCYGNYESFCIMADKDKFKKTCRENGVPVVEEFDRNDSNIRFPVIVKPVDSSGSKGISVAHDRKEMEKSIEFALSYSRSKHILIERFMTGDEVVCYYYFQDGVPSFVGMCDRYVVRYSEETGQLPLAYIYPSKHTAEYLRSTDPLMKKMCRNIGMENGPIFLQGFFEDGKAIFYEPGYRLCGAREHCIFSATTGLNSEDMLLNFAFTGKMAETKIEDQADPFLRGKYACKLSPVLALGKVARISGLHEAMEHPNVKYLYLNKKEGEEVKKQEEGTLGSLAYRAYIVADSLEELARLLDEIQDLIVFYDENGKKMILSKFDSSIILK